MKWQSRLVRVILRYGLFQLPGLVLLVLFLIIANWIFDLQAWLMVSLVLVWVAKDVILFPLTWRAYDQDRSGQIHSMIGSRGIVEERLAPSGYVLIRGERWRAEVIGNRSSVEKGESIEVQEIRGLTLLVQPIRESPVESDKNRYRTISSRR
jgi:membrane protein implicated in regulation of membrane protease activity